jgi:hypothetical protein
MTTATSATAQDKSGFTWAKAVNEDNAWEDLILTLGEYIIQAQTADCAHHRRPPYIPPTVAQIKIRGHISQASLKGYAQRPEELYKEQRGVGYHETRPQKFYCTSQRLQCMVESASLEVGVRGEVSCDKRKVSNMVQNEYGAFACKTLSSVFESRISQGYVSNSPSEVLGFASCTCCWLDSVMEHDIRFEQPSRRPPRIELIVESMASRIR